MIEFESLGFKSKVRSLSKVWTMKSSICLPSSRFDKFNRFPFGGFLTSFYEGGVYYLVDYKEIRDLSDIPEFEGVIPELHTDEDYLNFSNFRIFYKEKIDWQKKSDLILQKLSEGFISYDRGGSCYKEIGLYYANDKTKATPFSESLGTLLLDFC